MRKILYIHHWGAIGGAGVSLFHTWKSLKNHFEVVAYIPRNPPQLNDFLISKGLFPTTFPFISGQIPYYSGGSTLFRPSFWISIIRTLQQKSYWKTIISRENPDIIIVNSKVLCWMANLFKGRISICFVRETMKGNPNSAINMIMRSLLNKFTIVSYLSEYDKVQTNLKKAEAVVAPDFLVAENYLDKLGKLRACNMLNIDSNSFNVAYVGGLSKLKGIDTALKAMNYLKGMEIKLLVAGTYSALIDRKNAKWILRNIARVRSMIFYRYIRKYIEKNDLQAMLKIIGVQGDISTLYSASDILVFPMSEAHQARPVFEIGFQKKPAIITDFPNIKEFVKSGYNGLVFERNNARELSIAILKLKEDVALRKQLGENNYEYTLKYHTESYSMGRLIGCIDNIAKE